MRQEFAIVYQLSARGGSDVVVQCKFGRGYMGDEDYAQLSIHNCQRAENQRSVEQLVVSTANGTKIKNSRRSPPVSRRMHKG